MKSSNVNIPLVFFAVGEEMEKKVSGQLLVSLQQKNSLKCGNQSQVLLYLNSGFMVSTALTDRYAPKCSD